MRKSSWPVLACHTLTSWRLLVANKSDACLYYRDYNLYPLQVISLPWKADICDSIEVTRTQQFLRKVTELKQINLRCRGPNKEMMTTASNGK